MSDTCESVNHIGCRCDRAPDPLAPKTIDDAMDEAREVLSEAAYQLIRREILTSYLRGMQDARSEAFDRHLDE